MEITLTEKAKAKLSEMKNNNKPIKLKLTGYSWRGVRLGIVSEKQKDIDKVYNVDDIDIIVSNDLDGYIKGAEIDYLNSFFFRGFDIIPIYSRDRRTYEYWDNSKTLWCLQNSDSRRAECINFGQKK